MNPRQIYVIGAPPGADGYTSYERDPYRPGRLLGYATCAAAAREEALGDPFLPGYFFGDGEVSPMSSLPVDEYVDAVNALGLKEHVEVSSYDQRAYLYIERGWFWFEEVTTTKLRALIDLHDRRQDSAVVGRREVFEIEIED